MKPTDTPFPSSFGTVNQLTPAEAVHGGRCTLVGAGPGDPFQRINQLGLAQGSREALDLEAMVAQRLRRVGMDVFK